MYRQLTASVEDSPNKSAEADEDVDVGGGMSASGSETPPRLFGGMSCGGSTCGRGWPSRHMQTKCIVYNHKHTKKCVRMTNDQCDDEAFSDNKNHLWLSETNRRLPQPHIYAKKRQIGIWAAVSQERVLQG